MKQNYLKSMLVMLMMMVGMGAWAEEETITLANGVGSGSGTSYSITWSGTSCDITQTKESSSTSVNSSYISAPRWYASHKIAFKAKSGYTLTGATVKCTSNAYATELKNSTYSSGASASVSSSTVTITSSGDFYVTMGAQSRISSITVSYTSAGGSTPSDPVDASWSVSPASVSVKATKTATATITTNYNGTLSVSSANSDIATATINGKVITVTGVAEGSTTLTVKGAATSAYNAISKTIDVNVVANLITPASLPFDFDGGQADIANTTGMDQEGLGSDYASSPKLKFDGTNDYLIINYAEAAKKVSYNIKGNSFSGGTFDILESADGVNYTKVNSYTSDGPQNDILKPESRFVKFVYTNKSNGNIALGNISIIAASVEEESDLTFDKSAYRFVSNNPSMQVSASSSTGSTGAITYALTDGDADAFHIDANTGVITCETAGTYTVTATIAAVTGFKEGSTTCTVTIVVPPTGNSIIVAQADSRYYAMTTTCTNDYFAHKAIKKVGDKYVVSSLDDILFYTNTVDGKTTIQSTSDAQYVQATAAKKISFTGDEYKWTNDGEKLTAATASHGTLQYNTGSPRFTTYASKVGQYANIVDLSNVIVGDVVTLAAACTDGDFVYGTYSNASAWVVPSDLFVFAVWGENGTIETEEFNEGDVVPENYGVLVAAKKGGDYVVALSNEEGTDPTDGMNLLRATGVGIDAAAMAAADANSKFYRLTMHNGEKIGFWWGAADGAAFSLGANKAYLAMPNSSTVKAQGLWFGAEEDAIQNVETAAPKAIYDLQGRKVSAAQKGLYIINGKKVVK